MPINILRIFCLFCMIVGCNSTFNVGTSQNSNDDSNKEPAATNKESEKSSAEEDREIESTDKAEETLGQDISPENLSDSNPPPKDLNTGENATDSTPDQTQQDKAEDSENPPLTLEQLRELIDVPNFDLTTADPNKVLNSSLNCAGTTTNDSDASITSNYLWFADGLELTGATNSSLNISLSLLGKSVTCQLDLVDESQTVIESFTSSPVIIPSANDSIVPNALSLVNSSGSNCNFDHNWNSSSNPGYSFSIVTATTSSFGSPSINATSTGFSFSVPITQVSASSNFNIDASWLLSPDIGVKNSSFNFSIESYLTPLTIPEWPSALPFSNDFPNQGQLLSHSSCLPNIQVASSGGREQGHSCFPDGKGELLCFGDNSHGQLGIPSTTANSQLPVRSTHYDGESPAKFVIGAAVAQNTTCVLLADSSVECFGDDGNGNLGDGAGNSTTETPVQVSGIDGGASDDNKAVYLSGSQDSFCAQLVSGRVKCWGFGGSNRLGKGSTLDSYAPDFVYTSAGVPLEDVAVVSLNKRGSCAIQISGRAICWGAENNSNFGNGASGNASYATSEVIGFDGLGGNSSKALAIDIGYRGGCGIDHDGAVYCWGLDLAFHMLGDGNATPNESTNVRQLTDHIDGTNRKATKLLVWEFTRCALVTDGSVLCWGAGTAAQRGIDCTPDPAGLCDDNPDFSLVEGIDGSSADNFAISVFKTYSRGGACAIMLSGKVKCWGYGSIADGSPSGTYGSGLLQNPDDGQDFVFENLSIPLRLNYNP